MRIGQGATPRGSTVDELFEKLRKAIQAGHYAPGQRLIEADLTRDYGVSRGPVREALRRLAAVGVVDFVPNRGAMVRRFSAVEILYIFRIRQVLEGLSARLAAQNFLASQDKEEAELLRKIADGNFDDESLFSEENKAFHNAIVRLSRNPQLEELIAQMQLPVVRYQIRGSLDRAYLRQSRQEHAAIAQAILDNNPALAEQGMSRHLGQAAERLISFPDLFPARRGDPVTEPIIG